MAESAIKSGLRVKSWVRFLAVAGAMIMVAMAAGLFRLRLDLTEDKRYTLSEPTKKILENLKKDVYIQVYLDGEMPVPMKRLRKSAEDILDEFRIGSDRRIDFEFINPADAGNSSEREAQYESLIKKGLSPVNIMASDEEGGSSRKMIFPGMIVNCNGAEIPLDFLENNQSLSYEQNILHSIEGLEYQVIQTIATITSDTIYKVAFLEGQGEYSDLQVADITRNLAKYFTIDRGTIGGKQGIIDRYSAIIVAGPTKEFSEADKLVLDQYIMNGGKVLWLLEEVNVNTDSLAYGETVGLYYPLNIEDQLFRYGARINPEIVQDLDCVVIPLTVLTGPEKKQVVLFPWLYYPRLYPNTNHPITRNLNKVAGKFTNTIDTVGLDPAIKKTILLTTSANSKTLSPPLTISLKETEITPVQQEFSKSFIPVALLLEGKFPSAFRNRMTGSLVTDPSFRPKTESIPSKMIVVADGDIIRNDVGRSGSSTGYFPMNKDRYTEEMIGNRDFILNCVNYLVDDNGLMDIRSREVKLRLLNKTKVKSGKTMWQAVNISGPVLIVVLGGLVYGLVRKRRYTRF